MQSKHCLTSVTLPDSFTIFGTNIKCARIKRYDNTNLNTRTCNYEMDFTILNERCTVSKTKRKQRKFTTINTEKGLDKQETKPKKTYVCVLII